MCGPRNSGKISLLETALPLLIRRNLKIAVVTCDTQILGTNKKDKDCDRLFRAGADVFLQHEGFVQFHGENHPLGPGLETLCRHYDLVLVDGDIPAEIPTVRLHGEIENTIATDTPNVIDIPPSGPERTERFLHVLEDRLTSQWIKTPVFGCILIGGKSARMGRPKHLITTGNKTWLELTLEKLRCVTTDVIISGTGDIPPGAGEYIRLPDPPGIAGPMAGLLAAMRWRPWASWLLVACDMPDISVEALSWLLSCRAPGVWAVLPQITQKNSEPLLAYYDFRSQAPLEKIAAQGSFRIQDIAGRPHIFTPAPPKHLQPSWRNVNTEEDL